MPAEGKNILRSFPSRFTWWLTAAEGKRIMRSFPSRFTGALTAADRREYNWNGSERFSCLGLLGVYFYGGGWWTIYVQNSTGFHYNFVFLMDGGHTFFLNYVDFEVVNRKIKVWRPAAAAHLFFSALSFLFLRTLWFVAIFRSVSYYWGFDFHSGSPNFSGF